MKLSTSLWYAVGASAALTILAGCNAGQAQFGGVQPPPGAQSVERSAVRTTSDERTASRLYALTTSGGHIPNGTLRDRGSSWMSPDAKGQTLIYLSDADTADVDVYAYPAAKVLVGKLTGFGWPYGLCSDSAGNVYVSDLLSADVLEYAHGGTAPIKTLSVPGAPIGCAIDPGSGNLAVASFNSANPTTGFGGIFIFPKASGTPKLYIDPTLSYYWPPGYDNNGNLFVEGQAGALNALDELHRGRKAFTRITLTQPIGMPAGVQWDGTYLAATDQRYQNNFATAIYQLSIAGSTGTLLGTTVLATTASCTDIDIVQTLIQNGRVIGGNPNCGTVTYWKYPAGSTISTHYGPPFGAPDGVAISK